jgi:hypothetical protein
MVDFNRSNDLRAPSKNRMLCEMSCTRVQIACSNATQNADDRVDGRSDAVLNVPNQGKCCSWSPEVVISETL